ncbi:YchJ family protein [Plantactinospora sp. WMMB334]|uniref:YchJ family protein n=1 Tax=Plantactinospora sp. WMMB334 TaxID=3404119 RepID=UPI003B94E216
MARRRNHAAAADGAARRCPCGTGAAYPDCCGALHGGRTVAATAEALMRSRFSAYAVGDAGYLLRTWHSTTRPARLTLDPAHRWTRLDILDTDRGGIFDTAGTVEFRAHYRRSGLPGEVHERSRFGREDGQWRYLDAG